MKNLSNELKNKHAEIEWNKIAGMRDKLIHFYFGVNLEIVWDAAKSELPHPFRRGFLPRSLKRYRVSFQSDVLWGGLGRVHRRPTLKHIA